MALEISELITEFGANYKAGGQSVKDINVAIMRGTETDRLFTIIPTEKTELERANVRIGKVLQAFQKQFTRYGDTNFVPRKIPLFKLKIDWEEAPDEIEQSWLGFLASDQSVARKDWPLIKFMIDNLIVAKANEDWEMDGVYHGEASAIVAGTPKPIEGAINGIRFMLNKHIDDGDMEPIIMGALPTDPVEAVEYVEKFCMSIPKHIRKICTPVALPEDFYDLYVEGRGKVYNSQYAQVSDLEKVQNAGMSVVGLASHLGEQKIWTTIKGNAVMGFKKSQDPRAFKIEEAKRMVSAMTDWYKGLGFWMPEYVFTNDQDLGS